MTIEIPLTAKVQPRASRRMLAAFMLWPDNEVARDQWITAVAVKEDGVDMARGMPEEILRLFTEDLLLGKIPRHDDLLNSGDFKRRFESGVALGATIFRSVQHHVVEERAVAIMAIRKAVAEDYKSVLQIEPQTMANKGSIFNKLMPAAHFWAAFVFKTSKGEREFPCGDNFLNFLATAEALRKLAEVTKSPHSNSTTLKPDDALGLPAWLTAQLPKVELCAGAEGMVN